MIHSLCLEENPFSSADETTKKILLEQFERWNTTSTPVSVIMFYSLKECLEALKQWDEVTKKKNTLPSFSNIFSLAYEGKRKQHTNRSN